MARLTLPEEAPVVELMAPAADAAGRTGAYVSLKNAARAFLIVHVTQGNAATIALTVNQATSAAGGGSKAITHAVPIWANLDAATSDTLARATDAVSYTTDAGLKNKIVIFQIDPEHLDVAGGFDYVTVITGASNLANITAALAVLTDLRFAQPIPPTAVT